MCLVKDRGVEAQRSCPKGAEDVVPTCQPYHEHQDGHVIGIIIALVLLLAIAEVSSSLQSTT